MPNSHLILSSLHQCTRIGVPGSNYCLPYRKYLPVTIMIVGLEGHQIEKSQHSGQST